MNVCMCGAQAGFSHAGDCPYPLFRGGAASEQKWLAARDAIRERREDEDERSIAERDWHDQCVNLRHGG